jgi:exopolysaccharide biosynthesis polyprenyl glycosylphosphotransferase
VHHDTITSVVRTPLVRSGLKAILVLVDLALLSIAWFPILLGGPAADVRPPAASLLVGVCAVLAALAMIRFQGLWLSRVCAIRSIEVRLIARATALTLVALLLVDRLVFGAVDTYIALEEIAVGCTMMLVLLVVGRSVYRSSVRASRHDGANSREVIIIGTGAHAAHLTALIGDHPDYGMRAVGVIGDRDSAIENGLVALWLGPLERTEEIVTLSGVTGVVVSPAATEQPGVAQLVKRLQRRHIHVQVASGLVGFDITRLRHLHIAREPMIYLEQVEPRRIDHALKRLIDLVVSVTALVLTLPVLAVAAIAIKLTDRGPILFKQTRVGQHGSPFAVYKLRTMSVDAEARVATLEHDNERSGPLFKMEHDPRVTRVGRVLRLSSIDEIPQLLNVLRGEMSLVGPRPALPREVVQFDDELRRRELVKPGITGLWQVEARDSPSFDAYRRLDLFYVDNWTLFGDFDIMLDTFEHLVGRLVGALRKHTTATVTDIPHEAAPLVASVERPTSAP